MILRVRRILFRYEPLLSRVLTDTLLAAWLTGAQQAATVATPPPGLPPPPPHVVSLPEGEGEPIIRYPLAEEAVRDLAERRVMHQADVEALHQDAQRAAFTVARVGSLDALAKVQQALVDDLVQGGTLRQFRQRVDEALGTSALSPSHVENVYRTNVAAAYGAGQRKVLGHALVADEFPYVRWSAVHDSRTRPDHLAMEKAGIDSTAFYRMDDPEIVRLWPPAGFQCRCALIPGTLEDAAAAGVSEAREWLRSGIPPAQPARVQRPPLELPPGWISPASGIEAIV